MRGDLSLDNIKYICSVEKQIFDNELIINEKRFNISKCILNKIDNNYISIEFVITDFSHNIEDFKKKTLELTNEYLYRLSYDFEISIGNPVLMNFNFKGTGKSSILCIAQINNNSNNNNRLQIFKKDVESRKIFIDEQQKFFYKLFRSSILSIDFVSRFLQLYGLLMFILEIKYKIYDISQKKIDEFIKSIESDVKIIKNKYKKKDNEETIYTYYRNRLMHPHTIEELEETKNKIPNIIFGMIKIVKEAMKINI